MSVRLLESPLTRLVDGESQTMNRPSSLTIGWSQPAPACAPELWTEMISITPAGNRARLVMSRSKMSEEEESSAMFRLEAFDCQTTKFPAPEIMGFEESPLGSRGPVEIPSETRMVR